MQEAKESEKKEETKEDEKEEEVDIDLNDPQTEQAAIKIQAGFKGYKTRKQLKEKKESDGGEGGKTDEQTEQTEEKKEEIDIDLNDPDVEKAATKIQAGFKGYKTRKEMKATKESKEAGTDIQKEEGEGETKEEKTEGEEIDIDLNDPEVAKAATKIQAGFKGYKTRQELAQKKKGEEDSEKKEES